MGDFEAGPAAASHVRQKEVIWSLLEKAAQTNIFTACVLGKIAVVKPMPTGFPQSIHAFGPHGFTLLRHAQKGCDEALEVVAYVVSLGVKQTKISL